MRASFGMEVRPTVTLDLDVEELDLLVGMILRGRLISEYGPDETNLLGQLRAAWDGVRTKALDRSQRQVFAQ